MRYFVSLLLLVACSSIGVAAESKAKRTCRILFLSPPENAPQKVYLNDGADTRPVELPSLNLSEIYELAGGNIQIRLLAEPPVEGLPLATDLPAVAVPENVRDCYLLVTSDPKNAKLPLKLQIVDASPTGFRAGQMMWLNLTPYQVGGQLGSRTLNLKPNSQSILDSPTAGDDTYPVKIGYNPGKGQKPALIVSTTWMHNISGRNIVFVMMLPNSKIPRIKGYSDFRTPPKQGKTQ
ncbi:MAG: hypothetical protein QM627_09720 [Luteolibacter sp.]